MPRAKTSRSVARDIERDYAIARKRLEASLAVCELGSNAHVNATRAIYELSQDYRNERARRGLDPVSLGIATTPSFNFIATSVSSPTYETAKDKLFREEMNKEYGFDDSARQQRQFSQEQQEQLADESTTTSVNKDQENENN